MRRALVAGNWKMNGTKASAEALVLGLREGLSGCAGVDVVVCPSAVYMDRLQRLLEGSVIGLGAQNASEYGGGAYTGELSLEMLKEFGCAYVILGHSERRALFGETDAQICAKFVAAKSAGLVPVLCVGETLEEREAGLAFDVVGRQLDAVLKTQGAEALEGAVVAYEPVWAIGTGKTASPEQAQEVHAFIRARVLAESEQVANALRIVYGGSVNAANASTLFSMADIDGGLVGGASLKVDEFITVCQAAGR